MTVTFEFDKEEEIDLDFLSALNQLLKNKKIKVTVETEMGETAYLKKNEANYKRLLNSIQHVEAGTDLVEMDLEHFKKLASVSCHYHYE